MAAHPGVPWRLEIIRAVLACTHDAHSPLSQLRGHPGILEVIIRRWVWPTVLVDALIAQTVTLNPGLPAAKLREQLVLSTNGSIKDLKWSLKGHTLQALPELFGAIHTSGDLLLTADQLSSLPASFGSITVGGNLVLTADQ